MRTTPTTYGDVDIETLRRRHDIPRDKASALGEEAVRIIEAHGYTNLSGNRMDLQRLIEAARQGTVEYGPEDPVPRPKTTGRPSTPHITVRNASTLAAAHGLLRDGHAPAALNFASPTHPGGGFRSGARAQEEYLARSSALYACLQGRRMYRHSAGRKDPFLAEFVIVSPNVPVFRDDDGCLLDEPWCCTILTAPAVHARAVHKYLPERNSEIEPVMRARIHRVLSVAAAHGYRALVLGGWGCGAFGNDPAMIARLFREALAGEIGQHFDEVEFAVTDWSPEKRFIGPFERTFGSANVADAEREPPSTWADIQELALSLNGYEAAGSFKACGHVANTLSERFSRDKVAALEAVKTVELQYALFFEQRRWRHFGDDPNAAAMQYIRSLVSELGRRHSVPWLWDRVRQHRAGK